MASDLIGALRNRIFSLVDSIQPPSRYKALIVDNNVQRIFDHVLENHELLDRNVSSIQLIDQRRATEQYLEAIYILKPTRYNVECLAADYTRAPARYSGAHVFFLPELSDKLALKVRNSATGRFLRTLKIAYIDFWPIESQIFSLDDADSIEIFYGKQCLDLVDRHASHTANQLVSLCTSLNEYPIIRFFSPKHPESFQPRMLSYMIADKFQKALDKYVRDFPEFEPADTSGRPRSVFLIVDRPIDQFVPLLHDFTFQALSYDLLPIRDGIHVDYEVDGPDGKDVVHGVIEEKDSEWIGLRHQHMRDVTEMLSAKIEKLRKENPHFADQNSKTSVRDLQDMVAALPGFMKTRDRFALIVYMATECMNILESKQLIDLADIEQTLSLAGIGADGKKSKAILDEFITILVENPALSSTDKVRLILIYILYRKNGIIEKDLEKLIQHANLSNVDADVIRNYQLLGAPIIKESLSHKSHSLRPGNLHINTNQGLYNGRSSLNEGNKLHKDAVYYNTFHTHSTDDVYSVSRYVPGLKNITEKLIKGTLNSQLFQYTKDDPIDHDNDADFAHTSLRNPRQRAAWAKTSNFQVAKQRIFVFVVGGLTQAEARCAYELNKQYPKEVIFGGNSILTPGSFLRSLARLSVPRDRLNLETDARSKQVPAFLMESDRDTNKYREANPPPPQAQKPLPPIIPGQLPMAANNESMTKEKDKKKKSKFKLFK